MRKIFILNCFLTDQTLGVEAGNIIVKNVANSGCHSLIKYETGFVEGAEYCFVSEFQSNLSLQQMLDALPRTVLYGSARRFILYVLAQVLYALDEIHNRRMQHYGLKPSIIYIGKDLTIQLANLGLRAFVRPDSGETSEFYCPDKFGDPHVPMGACDIFSFGVVAMHFFVQSREYAGEQLLELFKQCANKDFSKRPTLDDLLGQNEIIQNFNEVETDPMLKQGVMDTLHNISQVVQRNNPQLKLTSVASEYKSTVSIKTPSPSQILSPVQTQTSLIHRDDVAVVKVKPNFFIEPIEQNLDQPVLLQSKTSSSSSSQTNLKSINQPAIQKLKPPKFPYMRAEKIFVASVESLSTNGFLRLIYEADQMASTPANTMLQRKQEEKKKLEIEKKKKKKDKVKLKANPKAVESGTTVLLTSSDIVSMSVVVFNTNAEKVNLLTKPKQPPPSVIGKILGGLISPFKASADSSEEEQDDKILGHISRAGIFMPFPVSFVNVEEDQQIQDYEEEDEDDQDGKQKMEGTIRQDKKTQDFRVYGESENQFIQNTPFVERLRLLQSYLELVYPTSAQLKLTSVQKLGIAAGLLSDRIKDVFNLPQSKKGKQDHRNLSDQRAYQFQSLTDKRQKKSLNSEADSDDSRVSEQDKDKEGLKENKKSSIEDDDEDDSSNSNNADEQGGSTLSEEEDFQKADSDLLQDSDYTQQQFNEYIYNKDNWIEKRFDSSAVIAQILSKAAPNSFFEFTPPFVNGIGTSETSQGPYVLGRRDAFKQKQSEYQQEGEKGLITMSALEDAIVGCVQDMKARVNYYNKLITQLIHPMYNLFIAVKPAEVYLDINNANRNMLYISHTAHLTEDSNFSPRLWLQFLGVIMAEAVVNNVTIKATPFSPFIFKALLAIPPNVADLEDVEPTLSQQLQDLRESLFKQDQGEGMNVEQEGSDYRFSIRTSGFEGDERSIELVHGGLQLKVTRENFYDFEALCANIGLLWNRAELLQALCIGFWSILPVRLLRMLQFNHEELKQMIFG